MADLQQALLTQKLEFLQLELIEAQRREDSLKALNDSLMDVLNHPSSLPDHCSSGAEIDRLKELHAAEVRTLHKQLQASTGAGEMEVKSLQRKVKELEFNLKQASVVGEREKLELQQKLQHLESDKLTLEHSLYSIQSDAM
jgi:hypothetical protein